MNINAPSNSKKRARQSPKELSSISPPIDIQNEVSMGVDKRLIFRHVSSLQEFVNALKDLHQTHPGTLWYRGISSHKHELIPSLLRGNKQVASDDLRYNEESINRRFRDRSMPYKLQGRDESSDSTQIQSWWRLFTMQHYGVPTRLLDWSENAITALCFAVLRINPEPGCHAVVWVLNPSKWNNLGNSNLNAPQSVDEHGAAPYAPLPNSLRLPAVWPLAIFGMHNNPRIVVQQGTFVIFAPGQSKSMEIHAIETQSSNMPLYAITIDCTKIKEIAKDLKDLGFLNSSLYPDLQGLATDLKSDFGY